MKERIRQACRILFYVDELFLNAFSVDKKIKKEYI